MTQKSSGNLNLTGFKNKQTKRSRDIEPDMLEVSTRYNVLLQKTYLEFGFIFKGKDRYHSRILNPFLVNTI